MKLRRRFLNIIALFVPAYSAVVLASADRSLAATASADASATVVASVTVSTTTTLLQTVSQGGSGGVITVGSTGASSAGSTGTASTSSTGLPVAGSTNFAPTGVNTATFSGQRSAGGDPALLAPNESPNSATFSIYGSGNKTYAVELQQNETLAAESGPARTFASTVRGAGMLMSENQTITVSTILNGGQASGKPAGSLIITVDYN